jgi:hypothetical protein
MIYASDEISRWNRLSDKLELWKIKYKTSNVLDELKENQEELTLWFKLGDWVT